MVGGGLGDIEETLAAGRRLGRAGFPVYLYRSGGRPMPRSVEGPWAWPAVRRRHHLAGRGRAALTVAPAWGISAGPTRAEPFGRGGAWEAEVAEIETAYGLERTLHVSLEEFARTLTPPEEAHERFREGGVPRREIGRRLRAAAARGEPETFVRAFRRFRAFERSNLLHVFATFDRNPDFARSFPEAVQTGPLWPGRGRTRRPPVRRRREWVWYASPSSAERIAPDLLRGLARVPRPPHLFVRTPWAWRSSIDPVAATIVTSPLPPAMWLRRFRDAELRIVTGSRTLLEALELGGPFLYFNGVLGARGHWRGHRPEKLRALLRSPLGRALPRDVARDLREFALGRRVAAIAERAATRTGGWARFPRRFPAVDFPPRFADAGSLLVATARSLERGEDPATLVRRLRAASNP